MQPELKRFPEWKQLHDAILPLIDSGIVSFTYEELDALSGCDIRSDRGRGQFYRFRRELLKSRQLWMENVPKSGYTIIPAKNQPAAAYKRVGQARRKVNMAKDIVANVQFEKLAPSDRVLQAATAAVLNELSKSFHAVGRKFQIASKQAMVTPADLKQLLASIEQSEKKK